MGGLRVFVLDDEVDARELLTTTVEQCDAIPVAAGPVREAVRRLHEPRPDVILADIGLPDQDWIRIHAHRANRPDDGARVPSMAVAA